MSTPEYSRQSPDRPLTQIKELGGTVAILVGIVGVCAPVGTALGDSFNSREASAEHLEHSDFLNQYIGHSARGIEKVIKVALLHITDEAK